MDSINKLIVLFVVGIIGVIGVGIIAGIILGSTQQAGTIDESNSIATARLAGNNINESKVFTLTNAPTGWELSDTDCQINNFVLTNASGTTLAGNFTLTTSTGKFTIANNTYMVTGGGAGNITLADYNYCADGYLADSFGRSGLNMVSGFFALLLLVIFVAGIYFVIKQMKE
jgi:hypothetical protein